MRRSNNFREMKQSSVQTVYEGKRMNVLKAISFIIMQIRCLISYRQFVRNQ